MVDINGTNTSSNTGGTAALRGFEFQAYSLVYYLLQRLRQHPDLTITIETDGDSVLEYPSKEKTVGMVTREIIQCRKREKKRFTPRDLRLLFQHNIKTDCAEKTTTNSPKTFYTALLLADLSPYLDAFRPSRQGSWGESSSWAGFDRWFPADYRHSSDPIGDPQNKIFNEETRKRLRVMVLPSWTELRIAATLLLQEAYLIPLVKAEDAVTDLMKLYDKCKLASDPALKVIAGVDIEKILGKYRVDRNRWAPISEWLKPENVEFTNRGAAKDDLSWQDFEENKYIEMPQYKDAISALKDDGFVVIHGHPGAGKTTLSRFLAYHYVSLNSNTEGYSLTVSTDFVLDAELHFLQSRLSTPTIFIIDDEQFAREEVKKLLASYINSRLSGRCMAKLVVTSTGTYSRKMLSEYGKQDEYLNYAIPIRFEPINEKDLAVIIDKLHYHCGIDLKLPSSLIARLSSGRIGIALLIMRASNDLQGRVSLRQLTSSKELYGFVKEWVLAKVDLTDHPDQFNGIIPIFLIVIFGISLDDSFSPQIQLLRKAGLMEPECISDCGTTRYLADFSLCYLINGNNKGQISSAFKLLFDKDPRQIVTISRRLASEKFGHQALAELAQDRFSEIVHTLMDPDLGLTLLDVSTVLSSIHKVSRPQAIRFFREMGAPGGELSLVFFDLFCRLEYIRDAAMITFFFETIHTIDSELARRLARDSNQLNVRQAEHLLAVLIRPEVSLPDIAVAIRAIHRCCRVFSLDLFNVLQSRESFLRKVADAEKDISALPDLLNYCITLYSIQRHHIAPIVDRNFTSTRLETIFIASQDDNVVFTLLHKLSRLRPRVVADTLALLWQEHKDFLLRRCLDQHSLVDYTNTISFISRPNKRIARVIALRTKGHAKKLATQLSDYQDLAAIDVLTRVIGWQYSSYLARSLNRDAILESMRNESHRFINLGKTLRAVEGVEIELAGWLEKELDFEELISRISKMHLQNLSYLLHGFLRAALITDRELRRKEFLDSALVQREFKQAWKDDQSLLQGSLSVWLLRNASFGKEDVLRLVGHSNWTTFGHDILERFKRETSLLIFANGLNQFADFSSEIVGKALMAYVQGFDAETFTGKREGKRNSYREMYIQREFIGGRRPDRIVDIGAVLKIAAAIDPDQALTLASKLDIPSLASSLREETNLGRLIVFFNGLHEASRALCSNLLEQVAQLDVWKIQVEETENLRTILHYAHVLLRISNSKGKAFVNFIVEQFGSEMTDFILLQGNLKETSTWLRILRVGSNDAATDEISVVVPALRTVFKYDSQLLHLLEAAEALMECEKHEEARYFLKAALAQSSQMRHIHKLSDLVTIVQKLSRLEEELGLKGGIDKLFQQMDNSHLQLVLFQEADGSLGGNPVLAAFGVYLLNSVIEKGFVRIADVIERTRGSLTARLDQENRPLYRSIVAALCQYDLDEIQSLADCSDWETLWERALANIITQAVYPTSSVSFTAAISEQIWQLHAQSPREFSPHASNLEFGISYQLVRYENISDSLRDTLQAEAFRRAQDESVSATRWVLTEFPNGLQRQPVYYIWSVLRETVLRPTYLPWENFLETSARAQSFHDRKSDWQKLYRV